MAAGTYYVKVANANAPSQYITVEVEADRLADAEETVWDDLTVIAVELKLKENK